MIISNPQTIQVLLAGAVTTNELPIATAWANMADDGSTFAPDNTLAETNGATAVDVLAAPSAGNKRQLKYLSVLNSDTASATVIVRVDASGTPTNLMRVVLAVGYRLEYTFTAGLRVFDASGALVGTGGGSGGGTVDSVIGGTGIDVDATDPANPIVELDAAAIASLALADSAVQPGDLATVATTGAYADLSGLPTLGTAAAEDVGFFATAAQGALADSATQPGDAVTTLNMATGFLLGRNTASSGAVEEITLGTNLSFTGTTLNATGGGSGTVTSVAATVPTGFAISGSPVTTSGTLAISFDTGYSLPTNASQANWDTAFTQTRQWDGGATGLTASTGRTSLGGTTVGQALFTATNPSALRFIRVNADNSVTFRTAAELLTDIAGAPLASPTFTGTPAAPTASVGTDTTQIATTAFVQDAKDPVIQSVTSSATVTPTFLNDAVKVTALAVNTTLANPTGTARDMHGIAIRIKDNGTARSIGYGSQYRAIGVTLPTTTVLGKTLYLGMVYNAEDTKWDVLAVAQEA